jgi:hypothetical protein
VETLPTAGCPGGCPPTGDNLKCTQLQPKLIKDENRIVLLLVAMRINIIYHPNVYSYGKSTPAHSFLPEIRLAQKAK